MVLLRRRIRPSLPRSGLTGTTKDSPPFAILFFGVFPPSILYSTAADASVPSFLTNVTAFDSEQRALSEQNRSYADDAQANLHSFRGIVDEAELKRRAEAEAERKRKLEAKEGLHNYRGVASPGRSSKERNPGDEADVKAGENVNEIVPGDLSGIGEFAGDAAVPGGANSPHVNFQTVSKNDTLDVHDSNKDKKKYYDSTQYVAPVEDHVRFVARPGDDLSQHETSNQAREYPKDKYIPGDGQDHVSFGEIDPEDRLDQHEYEGHRHDYPEEAHPGSQECISFQFGVILMAGDEPQKVLANIMPEVESVTGTATSTVVEIVDDVTFVPEKAGSTRKLVKATVPKGVDTNKYEAIRALSNAFASGSLARAAGF